MVAAVGSGVCGTTASGTVNQNVDPVAGALSAPIRPPMRSTNSLLIARPRPVPPTTSQTVSAWMVTECRIPWWW